MVSSDEAMVNAERLLGKAEELCLGGERAQAEVAVMIADRWLTIAVSLYQAEQAGG